MKPIVIIPALNPDEKLITLALELYKLGLQLVVVDDGSGEEYAEIFAYLKENLNCDICTHPKNLGKGAALKTAIDHLLKKKYPSSGFITVDSDGQHDVVSIMKVANSLKKHPNSLSLGTRDFKREETPLRSRFGNQITSFVFHASTGLTCKDTQTGLRGIPIQYGPLCLEITGERYEYEMNMLLEFAKKGIPLVEVPIRTIYLNKNRGSHFNPIKDSFRIYFHILLYSLSSVLSSIIDLSLFYLLSSYVFVGSSKILLSTVVARILSGVFNFILNKNWVFQSKNNTVHQGKQYSILFIGQMILSWFFVSLIHKLHISLMIVKIAVDTSLFFASYYIQKNYIFKRDKKGHYQL